MSSFPPWTNNNTYVVGDSVTYIGVVYSCIVTNIDIPPTNATYWVLNASANQTIVAGTGINVTGGSEPVVTVATNLSAGSNITLTPSGNNITIASGTGGVSSVTGGTNINITGSSGQFPVVNLNTALTDSFSSTGSANQVLSAGTSGGSLAWANTSSGLSSGTAISIADNGSNKAVITNTGVTSLTAGTGLSGDVTTGDVTLTNTGVTSLTAGTGIGLSGSTGDVTISNTGITSLVGGSNINISSGNTVNLNSSLTDNTSSTGLQNQVLTAGASGGSRLWSLLSSLITSGNAGISISNDSLNRAIVSNSGILSISGSSPISATTTSGSTTVSLGTSGVSASSYTLGNFTVDTYGRLTSASSSSFTSGAGITISGPSAFTGAYTFTNSSPVSNLTLSSGTGISVTGTNPSYTITNSSPVSGLIIASGTNISVTGSSPSFTVNTSLNPSFTTITLSSSSSSALSISGGGGISMTGGNGSISLAGTGSITTTSGNITSGGYVKPTLGIQDSSSTTGTSGYILSSTGSAVKWIAPPTWVYGGISSSSTLSTSLTSIFSTSGSITVSTAQPNVKLDGALFFAGTQPIVTNVTFTPTVQISYRIYRTGTAIGTTQIASIPPVPLSTSAISANTYYLTMPIGYIDTPTAGTYSYAVYCSYTNISTGTFSGTAPLILASSTLTASV